MSIYADALWATQAITNNKTKADTKSEQTNNKSTSTLNLF